MNFQSINPATEQTLRTIPEVSDGELEILLKEAHEAWEQWIFSSFEERSEKLRRAAGILREGEGEFASLMTREMGKPIGQAHSEVQKCAWVCEYFADNGADFLADQPIDAGATKSYASFRPLGVILAIMPWNFPFWQVFRFGAPALMAGNGFLMKHAPSVPGCCEALHTIFRQAGFPNGLVSPLYMNTDRVEKVIADPRVAGVTLTGSVRAGRAVAQQAGAALKKTVLELGGSDPYVILADADVEEAVATCVKSRLINNGESCIAAKRFIVVPEVREEFETLLLSRFRNLKMGDPMDEEADLGPLARKDLRDNLHRQVTESVEAGAKLLLGGEIPQDKGWYYPPTVLGEVGPGMPAYQEELFGPAAVIISAQSEAEAVRIANDSVYGLGAAVFTRNVEKGERLARDLIEAGNCFVNDYVKSDPRLPFGGIKQSGFGRELSYFGIKEFVNIKTVYVK